jgi:Fe-S cluster assembly iron-binding protein IscA
MLIVTPMAKEKLKETLRRYTTNPKIGIRVITSCLMPNRLDLVLDKEKRGDQVFESEEGIKLLLIQSDLASGLDGMILDYRETPKGAGFSLLMPTFH